MVEEKIIRFTGLDIEARKLIKKRVPGFWPATWARTTVQLTQDQNNDIRSICEWMEQNCTGRFNFGKPNSSWHEYNLTRQTSTNVTLYLVFENPHDALIFKLNDVRNMIAEFKPKDMF